MKHLVYKEVTLSIHKFFFILPILLGALLLIPNWIFTIALMYLIWISVPQIYSGYLAQGDYNFTAVLPINRNDIVKSKVYALFILEGIHIFFALLFGILHNILYGSFNIFMDINIAFFGLMMLLYAVFNLVFLPGYFKTAHYFGKPIIYGVIATLVYGFLLEYGVIRFEFIRNILEGSIGSQFIVLLITSTVAIILSYLSVQLSQANFKNIDLWNTSR